MVLRQKWIAKGSRWHSRAKPAPPGWDSAEQLRSVNFDERDGAGGPKN
jgi:hypothetical protein